MNSLLKKERKSKTHTYMGLFIDLITPQQRVRNITKVDLF